MTSADSLRQVLLRSSNSVRKASQGKNTIFPVIYPPHLHREFRIAWGFSFFGNLTHSHMPDAVPVRRTNGLPRASFRFHLTMDTLGLGCILPTTRADQELSSISDVRRKAHQKRRAKYYIQLFFLLWSIRIYLIYFFNVFIHSSISARSAMAANAPSFVVVFAA